MFLKRFITSYWKSIFILTVIFYLSFAPPSTFEEVPTFEIPYLDKIIHFVLYFVLSFNLINEFTNSNFTQKKRFIWVGLVCLIILGGLIEIAQQQYFAPRTAEWIDWISDGIGVFAGWGFYKFLKPKN
jgi:VanZ family protein